MYKDLLKYFLVRLYTLQSQRAIGMSHNPLKNNDLQVWPHWEKLHIL